MYRMRVFYFFFFFFFSSRGRHTRYGRDWSSDVCSSDLFPDRRAQPGPVERVDQGTLDPGTGVERLPADALALHTEPSAAIVVVVGDPGQVHRGARQVAELGKLRAADADIQVAGALVGQPVVDDRRREAQVVAPAVLEGGGDERPPVCRLPQAPGARRQEHIRAMRDAHRLLAC